MILRVEDTDEARSTRASEASILADLKWLNLNWDEGPEIEGSFGPYRQSERKTIYRKCADELVANGHAYPCFCTDEELDTKRAAAEAAGMDPKYDGTWRDADPEEVKKRLDRGDQHTIRFRVPPGKKVFIDDIVRGRVTWDADASLGDFIILRSNGMPVYNFCVAVDDSSMRITHVIRAEEHLTNTLRQLLILEALGSKAPNYAHCSLILGSDRSKLSKRHGATSLKQFSEQGFLPEAMMNYLANLGWNDGTPKEIYSPQELVDAFDLNRIIKSPSMFDFEKLRWVNSQHIRALKPDTLIPLVVDRLNAASNGDVSTVLLDAEKFNSKTLSNFSKGTKEELFVSLVSKIAQRDMSLLTEANKYVGLCLKYDFDAALLNDGEVAAVLEEPDFQKIVDAMVSDFDSNVFPTGGAEEIPSQWKGYIKELGVKLGIKGKALFHPARLALTGRMSGPDIGDQLQLLKASEGIILSSYPAVDVKQRIEYLRKFDLSSAKEIAAKTLIRLEEEKKMKVEEAAAASAVVPVDEDFDVVVPSDE